MINKIYDNLTLKNTKIDFDIKKFGNQELFDYQKQAIINTTNALLDYYQYDENNKFIKDNKLSKNYESINNNLTEPIKITLDEKLYSLYTKHFNKNILETTEIYDKKTKSNIKKTTLDFKHISNRLSYWMATGSGKTYVMIKLLETLHYMANQNFIEKNKILLLAPTNKILEQIETSIKIFNQNSEIKINLISLKDYNVNNKTYDSNSLNIYYYRSDNLKTNGLSTDKELNYEDFLQRKNDNILYGDWYLILDEAHKGTKKGDSSLQNIYNILSNGKGFLFNFSATFVDDIDKVSTIYNYNLAKYIKEGYGKQIKILESEFQNLKKKNDKLDETTKEKIILQSWLLFTIVKEAKNELSLIDNKFYHNPLMIVITNTINTIDADMKIYFKLMLDLSKNNIENLFKSAKNDLLKELENPETNKYKFTNDILNDEIKYKLKNITIEKIRNAIFNSDKYSNIEVIIVNKKEISFKLKNNSEPFALLNIGDTSKWIEDLKNQGFDIGTEKLKNSYFNEINNKSNQINILMGKNVFTEGWDSNRPNIINWINMGKGDGSKFLLQSLGRGVRIEPKEGFKQRFEKTNSSILIQNINEYNIIQKNAKILESLFIISTNKNVIDNILNNVENESNFGKENIYEEIIELDLNKNIKKENLLIMDYKDDKELINNKYSIHKDDLEVVKKEIKKNYKSVLYINGIKPNTLNKINNNDNFQESKYRKQNSAKKILKMLNNFFNIKDYNVEYKTLSSQIKHYKNITIETNNPTELNNIKKEIKNSINGIKKYKNEKDIDDDFDNNKITKEEYKLLIKNVDNLNNQNININKILEHYYLPLIMLKNNNDINIKNVITEDSEIKFIEDLIKEIKRKNNCFKKYKWWCFSKLVQNVDDIYIPYYNTEYNTKNKFYPDFIFWLQENQSLKIIFVDPKGLKQGTDETQMKIKGFEILKTKTKDININLVLYNQQYTENNKIEKYRKSEIKDIF